jgi:two-component system, cell cycle response regulator DivK
MAQSPLVLIVDDARDNREAYAEYLQHRGFRVAEANTGTHALEQAYRCNPDVIVLDLRLPDLAGFDVSRQLRATGFTKTVIIALSACVSAQDIASALESGCDAFLAKPCLPETVIAEIWRLVNTRAPC